MSPVVGLVNVDECWYVDHIVETCAGENPKRKQIMIMINDKLNDG